jgi:hypothetical protein
MRKVILFLIVLFALTASKSVKSASFSFLSGSYYSNFSIADTTFITDKKFNIFVSQGFLQIRYYKPLELQNGEVIVYNLLGQEVARKKLEVLAINQIPVTVQNTCYLVRISYSGKVYTQKVFVRGN